MNKFFFISIFFLAATYKSQVGINSSTPKSTLDLNKSSLPNNPDGFLTVRLTGNELVTKNALYGVDQNSNVVYVTTVPSTVTAKTSNITVPGFYYYNNSLSKWINLTLPKFFYMPSILFDTTVMGAKTKDLYQLYYDQFTSPAKFSTGALGKIPVVGKSDLEYYITYYDTSVFTNVSIDANGLLSYTVSNSATDTSFMNIVFVVK